MLRFTKPEIDGSISDVDNPLHMNIFGAIAGIVGGNSAANKEADALRMAREEAEGIYDRQQSAINPYMDVGRDAVGAYGDLLQSPGELDEVSQEMQRRDMTGTYNMLRARGQGGSGMGWNALMDSSMRNTLGYRQNRMSELMGGVGVGQNAIQQQGQAGRDLMSVYLPAQQGIGAAKAAGAANMWSGIGSVAGQVAGAIPGGGGIGGIAGRLFG